MTPHRVRHPLPWHGRPESGSARAQCVRPIVTGLALLVLAGVTVAGAAACGGSSGSPSASPSAASTAGTAPLAGSLREAAAEYWRLIDAGDYAAVAAAGVPGAAPSATAATDDIAHARLVKAKPLRRGDDGPGSALVQADVFIDPTQDAGNPTPWGAASEHQLFMHLQKAPQGGWLVKSWGTGP